jgi:hypothetical protein
MSSTSEPDSDASDDTTFLKLNVGACRAAAGASAAVTDGGRRSRPGPTRSPAAPARPAGPSRGQAQDPPGGSHGPSHDLPAWQCPNPSESTCQCHWH